MCLVWTRSDRAAVSACWTYRGGCACPTNGFVAVSMPDPKASITLESSVGQMQQTGFLRS